MKTAQITIFIVLGIVILIISGLVFFISRQTSDIVLDKKINRIYQDFLSVSGIKEYITNCLEKSTKDAIKLVALQGGKIYNYQIEEYKGGYNLSSQNETIPFNYTGEIYNISYGIKFPNNLIYAKHEDYPYPGSLVENPSNISDNYSSVFALVEPYSPYYSLTSLCNIYGPNYYNISNATYTCETVSSINTNISFQQYILDFIKDRTKKCVNIGRFTNQTKYNISEGNISGFVLMGDDDVFVSITYPIIITIQGKPPQTKFLEFVSKPKIRLKKIHELAIHSIGYFYQRTIPKADANNIFFNITRDDSHDCFADNRTGNQSCILDGMKIEKIRDYCLNNSIYNAICNSSLPNLPEHFKYSDVVNITDNKSMIDGKPLTLLFIVENRAPALDYINWNATQDTFYYRYVNSTFGKNIADIYNKVGTCTSDICVFNNSIIEIYPFGIDPDEDDLKYTINDSSFNKTNLNNFTRIPTPPLALGNYIVRINVSDNEGLYDFQDVNITVESSP